jgi:hypothetical protein
MGSMMVREVRSAERGEAVATGTPQDKENSK